MSPIALILIFGCAICIGVEPLEVHIPHEGSFSGWAVFVALNLVIVGAVVYKKRSEISGFLGTEIVKENEQLRRENNQLKERLSRTSSIQIENRRLENQNRDLREKLEALRNSSAQITDSVQELETSRKENEELKKKVQSQNDEIKKLKVQIDSTKKNADSETQALKQQVNQFKKETDNIKKEADSLKKELQNIKKDAEEGKRNNEVTQNALEASKKTLESLKTDLNNKQKDFEEAKKNSDTSKNELETAKKELELAKRNLETVKAESKSFLQESSQSVLKLKQVEEQEHLLEQQLKNLIQEKEKSTEENVKLKQEILALKGSEDQKFEQTKTKLEKELELAKRMLKDKDQSWSAKLEESKKNMDSIEKLRIQEFQSSQEFEAEIKKLSLALENEKKRNEELSRAVDELKTNKSSEEVSQKAEEVSQKAEEDEEEIDLDLFKVKKKESLQSPRKVHPEISLPDNLESTNDFKVEDLKFDGEIPSFDSDDSIKDLTNGEDLENHIHIEGLDVPQSLNIPDELGDSNFLNKLKEPKNLDENSIIEEKQLTPSKSSDFENNMFPPSNKKKSTGKGRMKGFDAQILKEMQGEGSNSDITPGVIGVLDPKSEVNNSKKKIRGLKDVFKGEEGFKPERKLPAFMDIFQKNPSQEPPSKSTSNLINVADMNTRTWTPGEPIIQDCSVKEDINKKGKRKAKKKIQYWQAGGKVEMEDQHLIDYPFANDPTKALFCIFDGHAGKNCAEAATIHFPKELEKRVFALSSPVTDISEVFKDTYLGVDTQLSKFEYEGCTSTTVYIWQEGEYRYLQCANVGDSTAFLLRGNQTVWLSKDHKPTSKEERARMAMAGIEIGENQTRVGGLAVSRALGDHFLKQEKLGVIAEPFVSEVFQLESTDSILVLASDGLWDVMTGEKAMELCSGQKDAEAMARRLLQSALSEPKCTDNITIMVVRL